MNVRKAWQGGLMLSVAVAAALISVAAGADVRVERLTKFGGVMGMGAFDSTEVEYLSGDKQRIDGTRKFTGAILGTLMGESKSSRITRLDKDLVWDLDLKKKTYTEESISAAMQRVKEMQEKQQAAGREQAGQPAGGKSAGETSEEKPRYKIVRNEVKTTKTGETKTIAGYQTQKYVVRWEVEAEDEQTKDRITYIMVSDQWLTPEDATLKQLRSEETAYAKAYAKLISGGTDFETSQKYGFAALGGLMDEKAAAQFQKELSKLEGYPVATRTRWITTAKEGTSQPSAADKSASSGLPAGTEEMVKSVGSMFGGFLKKGSSDKKEEPKSGGESADEGPTLFDSYSELKSVKVESLAAEQFEVPAGFHKVAGP